MEKGRARAPLRDRGGYGPYEIEAGTGPAPTKSGPARIQALRSAGSVVGAPPVSAPAIAWYGSLARQDRASASVSLRFGIRCKAFPTCWRARSSS